MVLATVDVERPALGARGAVQGDRRGCRLRSCFTPIISRARAANSRRIRARPWYFTGITAHRQVRAEGRVERLSEAENDAYFQHPPLAEPARRLGQPAEPAGRVARGAEVAVAAAARRFGIPYAGPGTPEPARSPRKSRGRRIGAAIASSPMRWNCGWKANTASTTGPVDASAGSGTGRRSGSARAPAAVTSVSRASRGGNPAP